MSDFRRANQMGMRRPRANSQTAADDGPRVGRHGAFARSSTTGRALHEERTRLPNYRSGQEECGGFPNQMRSWQAAYHLGAGPSQAVS